MTPTLAQLTHSDLDLAEIVRLLYVGSDRTPTPKMDSIWMHMERLMKWLRTFARGHHYHEMSVHLWKWLLFLDFFERTCVKIPRCIFEIGQPLRCQNYISTIIKWWKNKKKTRFLTTKGSFEFKINFSTSTFRCP